MALIKCPECGNDVSDKAKSCPKCGCPIEPASAGYAPYYDSPPHEYTPPANEEYAGEPKGTNGLGVAGFVVSLIGVFVRIGSRGAGLAVGGIAFILALFGLILAKRNNWKTGLAVTGLVIAVCLCFAAIPGKDSTSASTTVSPRPSTSSEVSSSATPVVPRLTEDEYKAECKEIDYKELCRYPEKYTGSYVVVTVQIKQTLSTSVFSDDVVWRAYTDNDGYGYYFDDEYYLVDSRAAGSVKILDDDIVVLYGEFTGIETVTRALTKTKDEIPCIDVEYIELVEETE